MKTEDFVRIEKEILAFWNEHRCLDKLKEKNRPAYDQGRIFRFLDGPITANNSMGIHHAWGRSTKDVFIKYKSMNGYHCHFINGFDSQGLWVEVEQEKELGFSGKKDIEAFGLEKFTRACEDRVRRFSHVITEQSKRLGQWMDWPNSYFTHTDTNIQGIWYFLSVCHKNGWIAEQHRPMPWCPRCGTSLSEHEMAGSHRPITHRSVYILAPIKGHDFSMMAWTTTPWTLTANVALAVNPELDYVEVVCDVAGTPRHVVLAKSALGHIGAKDEKKDVRRIFKGAELLGLEYETFLSDLPIQQEIDATEYQGQKSHRVIAWEMVAADEGTGIVHIAPGCGLEDNELGKTFGLPEICPIDEAGIILPNYAQFSGLTAADAAPVVIETLTQKQKLYKAADYEHSYPVCWRCKHEVLFRLVNGWYIRTNEIRPKLLAAANEVIWRPEYIGKRMKDWLTNMGDWNISRKRFYGLPLPFYKCPKCGKLTVVSSREELKQLSDDDVDGLPELHRPWIDSIRIRCPECGETVSRIPEVGDVWLDAGITPFSTLFYFSDREKWNHYYPIEWVSEMREQVRLWFYSLLFMGVTLTGKAPYQQVFSYGSVIKEDGGKFSKSGKGNIRFDDAAEQIGADAIRYLYAGANPSSDVRFGYNLAEEARRRLLTFWNIYSFFTTYAEIDQPECFALNDSTKPLEHPLDQWLYHRMNRFVDEATRGYEAYSTPTVVTAFEQCIDDVSTWYVRLNRRRFWRAGSDTDKRQAYSSLFRALRLLAQTMAPITPFLCEYMWQNGIRKYGEKIGATEESVLLCDWPSNVPYDETILKENTSIREIIAAGMNLRSKSRIKVKQPLPVLYLEEGYRDLATRKSAMILAELNIREIRFVDGRSELMVQRLGLNFRFAGKILRGELNAVKTAFEALSPEANAELLEQWNAVGPEGAVTLSGYAQPVPAGVFTVVEICPEQIAMTSEDQSLFAAIDTTVSEDLRTEGFFRELLRHCQVLRKEAGYEVVDRVELEITSDSDEINRLVDRNSDEIEQEVLAKLGPVAVPDREKEVSIGGMAIVLKILRRSESME